MTRYQTIEQRAASASKRKATAQKHGEPFEVQTPEGPVTLTKQPMEWDYPHGWDYNYRLREKERAIEKGEPIRFEPEKGDPDGPLFKVKYKVEFEGVHRGWMIALNGWGKPWVLYRAASKITNYHIESATAAWWHVYSGGLQIGDRFPLCAAVMAGKAGGRDALARLVPDLVRAGELPLREEAESKIKQVREEARQKRIRAARESAAGNRESAAKQDEAFLRFTDEANALEEIADSHRQSLSNYQLSVLLAVAQEKRALASGAEARAGEARERARARDEEAEVA